MVTTLTPSSNINAVKTQNTQAILQRLLYEGSISRVELARQTELSSATVTNLTAELIGAGIVAEVETTTNGDAKRRVGRPRRLLSLVPRSRCAIGAHIGVGLFRVAITDLNAEIIDDHIVTFDTNLPAERVLEQMVDDIETLIRENGLPRERILGVGVGASGLVDRETGLNLLAPRLAWKDVHIQAYIESRLELPVIVDNNVRAMAVAEAFFGSARGVGVLAFVYGRIGVGAGFMVNGHVFRGSGAGAGEIGHVIMIDNGGALCRCGQRGCLETLVSEPVLIQRAMEIIENYPDSALAQMIEDYPDVQLIDLIFEAALSGDERTRRMVDEQMRYLGVALANLVNVLNPEMILLGGIYAQGDELILPVVRQTVRETAFAGLGDKVTIQSSSFGWRAGVVGAASLALMEFFYQKMEA